MCRVKLLPVPMTPITVFSGIYFFSREAKETHARNLNEP